MLGLELHKGLFRFRGLVRLPHDGDLEGLHLPHQFLEVGGTLLVQSLISWVIIVLCDVQLQGGLVFNGIGFLELVKSCGIRVPDIDGREIVGKLELELLCKQATKKAKTKQQCR